MLRENYERQVQRLQDELLMMGSMVEKAIIDSVAYLKERNFEGSRRLIAEDAILNKKRFDIEADTLALIATQQPMARDLRNLAAILEIVTELERIGDYAKGISRISLMIGTKPLLKPLIDIPRMAEKAVSMLHRAQEAFVRQDVELAMAIAREDNEVDALYNQVYRELLTYILSDPTSMEQANYLLWAAHNLERTADRVTNICERVVFTVTGRMQEMDVESGIEDQ
jgi:phosphate transport system protein